MLSAVLLVGIAGLIIGLGRRGYEEPGTVKDAVSELAESVKE